MSGAAIAITVWSMNVIATASSMATSAMYLDLATVPPVAAPFAASPLAPAPCTSAPLAPVAMAVVSVIGDHSLVWVASPVAWPALHVAPVLALLPLLVPIGVRVWSES